MKRWTPLLSVLLLLALTTVVMACPNCKDSVSLNGDGSSSGGLPSGFNNSIYFMLLGFFATVGLVTFTIVKGVRSTGIGQPAKRGFPLE